MTICTRRAVLALAALPALRMLPALAATPVPAPPSMRACQLPVFDLLAYKGKPDLRPLGITPIRIFSAQHLWSDGEDRDHVPRAASVARAFARERQGERGSDVPIMLDIEHWPVRGNGADATVTRLLDLLALVREQNPKGPVGFYGFPPLRDYWRAARGSGTAEFIEWQRDNDRFRPVAEAVDALFPSLYTFYDDVDGWRRYAIANLTEARRCAGSRRIHAFIWPQYHGSNKLLANQFLSAAYWRVQLEVVSEYADGAVLWGGWGSDGKPLAWSSSAPWWVETRRYLAERNRNDGCP